MARYIRRTPASVEAIRLLRPITLDTPSGPMRGEAGDYLVTEGARQYVVGAAEFEAGYERQSDLVIHPFVPFTPTYPTWVQPVYRSPNIIYGSTTVTTNTLNPGALNAQLMAGTISHYDAGD